MTDLLHSFARLRPEESIISILAPALHYGWILRWCSTTIIAECAVKRSKKAASCVWVKCGPHTSNAANHLLMAAQETNSGVAGGGALVRETTPLVAPWSQESALQPRSCGQNKCVFFDMTPAAALGKTFMASFWRFAAAHLAASFGCKRLQWNKLFLVTNNALY